MVEVGRVVVIIIIIVNKRMVRGWKEEAIISGKERRKEKKGHSFRVLDHEKCNMRTLIIVIVIVKK